ncbi:hypothetical protein BJV82DRAFT_662886 [Fennellomyces sp. T-0311]|nr:hypothetical protein BJV82DRAFT_662886 [Fennellomyces sp. T-0311]
MENVNSPSHDAASRDDSTTGAMATTETFDSNKISMDKIDGLNETVPDDKPPVNDSGNSPPPREGVLCTTSDDNSQDNHVTQNERPPSPPITLSSCPGEKQVLTEASLAEQNKLMDKETHSSSIRAWAATLPEIPDNVQPPMGPSHIFELPRQSDASDQGDTSQQGHEPRIQETKDVFTDTQKIAYVGLCAVTSLEVVHDFQGKEFTYARMSADNWQRKIMRTIYMHMDISSEESLARHGIKPTDLVFQFTAQGETTTVDMGGFHEVQQPAPKHPDKPTSHKSSEETAQNGEPVLDDNQKVDSTTPPKVTDNVAEKKATDKTDDDKVPVENTTDGKTATHENTADEKSTNERSTKDRETTIDSQNVSRTSSSDSSSNKENDDKGSTKKTESSISQRSSISTHTPTSANDEKGNGQFVIDLRWTVMCDLFILCLSAENYDARSRVFIARMASYLELDWFQVIGFEKRITEHIMLNAGAAWETETATSIATTVTTMTNMEVSIQNDVERASRNKQRRKKRYIMIGLATIGGGLILGLSAGLMAPVIAGGIGTILTTVGVTGTSGFLGGTASIALITGGATAAGSSIGARSMRKRMKTISTFEFSPVLVDESVSCIVSISGWLPKGAIKDTAALPFSTLDSIMGDHYTLWWEPEMLEALGSAFKIFATEAVTFSIQQGLAHTIMGALLAGLAWPLALTKLAYLVDNPWNNGLDRARLAGLILADSLMNRNLGARPVTLVGYSLGARVIFYCLLELARVNAYGLVENVALFGTPVSASKSQWKECTTVVSGRFVNGYATSDWLLGFLFRASTAGLGNVAGLRPIAHIEGDRVQNVDCTDLVKGHLSYRMAMPKLLKRAGFVVTSEELPDPVKEGEEDEDEFVIDLSGAKDLEQFRPATMVRGSSVSSLTSGKASIQYPPPKTKCHPPRTAEEAMQQKLSPDRRSPEPKESPDPQKPETQQSSPLPQRQSPDRHSPEPQRLSSEPSPIPGQQLSEKPSLDEQPAVVSSPVAISSPKFSTSSEKHSTSEIPQQKSISDEATLVDGVSDQDIIADIIAKAAAVSKSSSNYSSLSSGRASIAQPRPESPTMTHSSSETTTAHRFSMSGDDPSRRSISSSSLFSKSLLFKSSRKKTEEQGKQELSDAGVAVKEIKSTLGRMVVPADVVNPMPKFTLEKPQYARINR